MIGSFYIFFVEASQHLLNHWIAGSRQVLALLGAGGRRRSTLAVVGPVPAGGAIAVSEGQRRVLEALVRRSSAPQRLVRRAQIILMLAAGKTFNQVARALGVLRQAVYKWYNRLADTSAAVGRGRGAGALRSGVEQQAGWAAVGCLPPRQTGHLQPRADRQADCRSLRTAAGLRPADHALEFAGVGR